MINLFFCFLLCKKTSYQVHFVEAAIVPLVM